MSAEHFRAILTARNRCEVNSIPHIGRPLGIKPRNQRRWWRFGR